LQVDLDRLKRSLLTEASIVEESVLAAVKALQERDRLLAQQVIDDDTRVDDLEVDIEEDCLKILALHQPVASDLRLIVSVLKINNDLERIADLAVNVAERAAYLATQEPIEIPFALPLMVDKTTTMLKRALQALVKADSKQAYAVLDMDDEVDAINREAFQKVEQAIRDDLDHMERLIHLLSVARHLERVADLATNIAEDVIYLIEGEIVRHRHEEYERQP
jgi:phosphate transport system protein